MFIFELKFLEELLKLKLELKKIIQKRICSRYLNVPGARTIFYAIIAI